MSMVFLMAGYIYTGIIAMLFLALYCAWICWLCGNMEGCPMNTESDSTIEGIETEEAMGMCRRVEVQRQQPCVSRNESCPSLSAEVIHELEPRTQSL